IDRHICWRPSPGTNVSPIPSSDGQRVACLVLLWRSFATTIIERKTRMKRFAFLLVAGAILARVAASTGTTSPRATAHDAAPIFVTKIPPGYRDWKVVSVAHEAGDLNDIRVVLGNDIAIKAYRGGKLPFPEGAIVGRIAWSYVLSEENNKSFGREQSFVAGS